MRAAASRRSVPRLLSVASSFMAVPMLTALAVPARALPLCTFLTPIGDKGNSPIVNKSVGAPKVTPYGMLLGRTNWNTDFAVNQPFSSYKFFFTANSSDPNAKYPIQAYMKFTDGTSLQVVNEVMNPPMGTGRMFGPFQAVPGKQASQMNFKVGASADPGALGFSYRISVQGCTD
jgi:hypothetical protein